MKKLKEDDIQRFIYENLEKFPSLINFKKEKRKYQPNKNNILQKPLKYLISKNYNYFSKIFENWESRYEEFIHKFPREFDTAENNKSRPSMDIFINYNDKEELSTNFIIFEIKNDSPPTRQTLTELLQYSNGVQMQDFPGLENDKICFIIISKDWPNILIQSIVNGILFKGLNILPLQLSHDGKNPDTIKIRLFDIYNESKTMEKLGKKVMQKKGYKSRVLCFGDPENIKDNKIKLSYSEQKILSMTISKELEKKGYNGFVFFKETNGNIKYANIYNNCIIIITFDWLNADKEWSEYKEKKSLELGSLDIDYTFSTEYIRNILRHHFLNKNITFEEGKSGFFSDLSDEGWLFSHGTSFGFLNVLHEDLVNYLHDDIDFRLRVLGSDDIGYDEIFNWQIVDRILKD